MTSADLKTWAERTGAATDNSAHFWTLQRYYQPDNTWALWSQHLYDEDTDGGYHWDMVSMTETYVRKD